MTEKTLIETPKRGKSGQLPFPRNLLLLVAFIEGGAIMAIELAGAKMVAPFYGTSLYVWASVLAVTLGGLTTGYFLGGWTTYRYPAMKLLIGALLAGTVLIAIMPLLALKVMPATNSLGLRMGSLVSCTLFMFLPLVCMGMVSPAIIQISNRDLKGTGRTAGTIYAISTVGGIIMTLLMGFFLLPDWGIRNSIYLTAILLGSMAVMLVVLSRKFRFWATAGTFVIVFSFLAAGKLFTDPDVSGKYIYRSEGILGQATVFQYTESSTGDLVRLLMINQITQTYVGMWATPDPQFAMWSSWKVVNHKDGAVLARYDHFVAKCAHFVERNRAVVREGAPDVRKVRDDTSRELIDGKAFCDEKVGRVEPGVRGLYWSELQVFFNAGVIPSRNLPHHRRNPHAVDMREILAAP